MPDGVYYIKYGSLYLSAEDSGIADGTSITQEPLSSDSIEALSQTWRIHYLGNGYYSVRPMHKLNMGLDVSEGIVDIWGIGTTDTLSIPEYACWKIIFNTTGYVFINNHDNQSETDLAMRPNGGSSTAGEHIYNDTYNSTSATFRWTLTPTTVNTDAIIYSDGVANDAARKGVMPGQTRTLAEMGIVPAFVCASKISQTVSRWYSSNLLVATVDSTTGAVTGVSRGSAAVTAVYTLDGIQYLISFTIVVSELPVSGYELNYDHTIWSRYEIEKNTNCYSYALNNQVIPNTNTLWYMRPGDRGGEPPYQNAEITKELILYYVERDSEELGFMFEPIGICDVCPPGSYKVMLFVFPGEEFHWYRQDADGKWSHKPGQQPVADYDEDYMPIWNPIDAASAYSLSNQEAYVGCYAVTPLNNLYQADTPS